MIHELFTGWCPKEKSQVCMQLEDEEEEEPAEQWDSREVVCVQWVVAYVLLREFDPAI